MHLETDVLKCGFCYHSGIVRPTDQEITINEEIVSYSSQKDGAHNAMQGPLEKHRTSQEAGRTEEKYGQGFFVWFVQEDLGQDWVNRFRIGWTE